MDDIGTSFVGIQVSSPVVVGACTLSNNIDNIKRAQYIALLMNVHDPRAKYGLVWGTYPVRDRPGRVSG